MQPFPDKIQQTEQDVELGAKPTLSTLGYYGLVPFAGGAILVWLSPWLINTGMGLTIQKGTLAYAGIIASYLAGMGAGQALHKNRPGIMAYLPGMIATLIAWAMVLPDGYFFFSLGPVWRMLIMILVFGWLFTRDSALTSLGVWPSWYGRLRMRLTAWVAILLCAIIARLLLWGYI